MVEREELVKAYSGEYLQVSVLGRERRRCRVLWSKKLKKGVS